MGLLYIIGDLVSYFFRHTIYQLIRERWGLIISLIIIFVIGYIWIRMKRQ